MEIVKEKELYEAKMQFFTNVAHEIKTPLTLIKGPLEKVMRKAGEITEIKDSLRIMSRNTDRLVDLTNQLLDFRQTEINGFGLTFTKQDITEILDETFMGFKPLAEQRNLSFRFENLSNPVFALVDIDAFTKIITNLLSNAIKYARNSAELRLLPVMKGDNSFTIEVMNDGYLIPFDMKEKIFEPFFRLKETEKQKGTGIGLALSRSLAVLQKGVLDLREPDGKMNVFFLTLPLHQDETNASIETTLANDESPVLK
ncbi:MAG: HAMP domain-containing histidine kinase, partial [Chitinophagaceae bacterium]